MAVMLTENLLRTGNTHSWDERTTALTASDAAANDYYGITTALSGDGAVLAVGAYDWEGASGTDRGAVYIYDWNGSAWVERSTILTASDAADNDGFGRSVALSDDGAILAVGAYEWEGSAADQGAVYVFDWGGSSWTERTTALTASDAVASDRFGVSCALSSDGTILAVGSYYRGFGAGTDQGAVYIYDWNGSAWVERSTILTASDAGNNDNFGVGCSLSGDGSILAVGAFAWDGSAGSNQGAVYIFDWNGSSWTERTTALTASDAGASDLFGSSCALSNDGSILAVGALDWDGGAGGSQGAVYVFDWNGSSWDERTTALTPSDAAAGDLYGAGVSLSSDGKTLSVGAYYWEGANANQGCVYVHDWIGSTSGSNIGITDGRTSTTESFESGIVREIIVDNGSATDINCIAAARHNLSTMGATLAVEGSSNGTSFSALFSVTPTDDNILLSLQSTQSYRYYKIKISGHTGTVTIADLAIGKYITLERDQKYGFIAPEFADGDQIIPNITRGNNLAGLSVKEGFKRIKLQLPYYTSSFYDTNWSNITAALKSYPIYLNWKLANDAVPFYCWPSRALPQAKYSANISGYAYLDSTMDLEGITS